MIIFGWIPSAIASRTACTYLVSSARRTYAHRQYHSRLEVGRSHGGFMVESLDLRHQRSHTWKCIVATGTHRTRLDNSGNILRLEYAVPYLLLGVVLDLLLALDLLGNRLCPT